MRCLTIGKNLNISLPDHFGGANYMVIGAPGSGKTRYFLEPCVLQMTEASHMIVDIKGSLYSSLAPRLRHLGYAVHNFDFINFSGEKYNPIEFVSSEEDAYSLASIIIGKASGSSDPYWIQSSTDFLTAMIGYAASFPEHRFYYLKAESRKAAQELREDIHEKNTTAELPTFTRNGNKISSRFRLYFRTLCRLSLGDLFGLVPEILEKNDQGKNRLLERFEICSHGNDDWWPLKRITPYAFLPEKTVGCVVSTLLSASNALRSEAVEKMMTENEYNPKLLGRQKQAVFIRLKDYDSSLHPAAALMISNGVNDLLEEAGNGSLDVPVQIWMDDCGSYQIPDLVSYLSCCRSRNIGFTMLCQSEHQLQSGYGPDEAETLVQCANAYVYMGGQDITSARRISIRGNIMLSTVLAMPPENMYVMQQGKRLMKGIKLDEKKKKQIEGRSFSELQLLSEHEI